jgi:5-formyltetrahydrofolate cyclo-ligase
MYLPILRNKEPNTFGLLNHFSSKNYVVILTRSHFDTLKLDHLIYDPLMEIGENKFGIPEPLSGEFADLNTIEAVLIPLSTADKQGNRLGYGKGFYDRFLAELKPSTLKIGCSIMPLFDEFAFIEPHDVKLDYCITPYQIINF